MVGAGVKDVPDSRSLTGVRRMIATSSVGVLHVVDALYIGGAERVAINLVNLLPRDRFAPYLCSTRAEGPLSSFVAPHVTRLCLERRRRLDPTALRQFCDFVADRNIRIVHAHASALFFARLASALSRRCSLIWHDHYGRADFGDRPAWLYRMATRGVAGVIAVNQTLARWCSDHLRLPSERVWYIPNLVPASEPDGDGIELPGEQGKRLVCVANFRPQKDHPNLLRAMSMAAAQVPGAHLFLVGDSADPAYVAAVRAQISELNLDNSVTYMGPRNDVPAILRGCDIGVLGSASEGLPLALLEYGRAGLAAVATSVGQCPEVLDNGHAGILVRPGSPEDLGHALVRLLRDRDERARYAARFQNRVDELYHPRRIMRRVCDVYETVLEKDQGVRRRGRAA
jgi:glycosyltransferase involved in cell wall biosynthesis